jgi:hypothetical protein
VCNWVPRPVHDAPDTKTNESKAHPKLELNLWDFSTEPDDCFLDLTLSLKPSFPGTGAWIFCHCKSVSMVLIYCSIFVGVAF